MDLPWIEINGFKIMANIYVSDVRLVKRTWAERLFEFPWRPFVAFNSKCDPKAYVYGTTIFVSPKTFLNIEREGQVEGVTLVGGLLDVQGAHKALKINRASVNKKS
jgi:hypothetical protein